MKKKKKKKKKKIDSLPTKRSPGSKGKITVDTSDPYRPNITIKSANAFIILEILDGVPGFKMFDSTGKERFAIYVNNQTAFFQFATSDGRVVQHVMR